MLSPQAWPYWKLALPGSQPSFDVWSGAKNLIGSYHVHDQTLGFPGAMALAVPSGTSPITPVGQCLLSTQVLDSHRIQAQGSTHSAGLEQSEHMPGFSPSVCMFVFTPYVLKAWHLPNL